MLRATMLPNRTSPASVMFTPQGPDHTTRPGTVNRIVTAASRNTRPMSERRMISHGERPAITVAPITLRKATTKAAHAASGSTATETMKVSAATTFTRGSRRWTGLARSR